MKIWKILSPKVLTSEERPDNITTTTQAKVKVTKMLLSGAEIRAFYGTLKPKYPVYPGRFAVGVVTEAGEGCLTVEKNTRVYLHDVLPCNSCERCVSGKGDLCASPKIAGVNTEGYMRDFVVAEEAALSPLPPSVPDEEALFIGIVSICEAVIDKLHIAKGMHIAVIGASELGNILSQLLIYHQAVPILIDSDEEKLKTAAACGIYYTLKADADLKDNISRITGGRLASGSVHTAFCGLAPDFPFQTTAPDGIVVYTGFAFPDSTAQLKTAMENRLTLTTVTNDSTYYASAINLLVNKAVHFAPFRFASSPIADAESSLLSYQKSIENCEALPYKILTLV